MPKADNRVRIKQHIWERLHNEQQVGDYASEFINMLLWMYLEGKLVPIPVPVQSIPQMQYTQPKTQQPHAAKTEAEAALDSLLEDW